MKIAKPPGCKGRFAVIAVCLIATNPQGCQTHSPRVTPGGGTYACPLVVNIKDSDQSARIYYTTDGTAPTESSSKYIVPISLTASATLRAVAIASGRSLSEATSATYECQKVTLTRREFAVLVKQAFPLRLPAQSMNFPDVSPHDPDYQAIQTVAPFMNSQVLCPGCQLNLNFFPDQPVTRAISTITLVRIVLANGRMQLLGNSESEDVLAQVKDAGDLPMASRPLFATAIRFGILTLTSENTIRGSDGHPKTEMIFLLDKMRRQFNLAHSDEQ